MNTGSLKKCKVSTIEASIKRIERNIVKLEGTNTPTEVKYVVCFPGCLYINDKHYLSLFGKSLAESLPEATKRLKKEASKRMEVNGFLLSEIGVLRRQLQYCRYQLYHAVGKMPTNIFNVKIRGLEFSGKYFLNAQTKVLTIKTTQSCYIY